MWNAAPATWALDQRIALTWSAEVNLAREHVVRFVLLVVVLSDSTCPGSMLRDLADYGRSSPRSAVPHGFSNAVREGSHEAFRTRVRTRNADSHTALVRGNSAPCSAFRLAFAFS